MRCLFIVALWSPVGKGLTSWLPCVWHFVVFFVTFQYGVLSQVWYLSWRRETGLSPPVKYFLLTVPRRYFFCGSFALFMTCVCHAFALFITALWSPAGKGLTSWLLFVMSNCDLVTFPCGILGQVWYLIVLIPDLCRISYFDCIYS